jgi:uncharacterized membrane protein HdeD (DUF308 family)
MLFKFWLAVTPVIMLRFGLGIFLMNIRNDLTNQTAALILLLFGIWMIGHGAMTGYRAVTNFKKFKEFVANELDNE